MKIIKKIICISLTVLISIFSMTDITCLAYSENEKEYECSKCIFYPNAYISTCSSAFKKVEPNGKKYKFSVNKLYKHPDYRKYYRNSYDDYDSYSYKFFKFSLSKKQLVSLNIGSDLPYLSAYIEYADGKNGTENGYYMNTFNLNYSCAASPSKYLVRYDNFKGTAIDNSTMGDFTRSRWEFEPEPGYQIINSSDVYNLDKGDYVIIFKINDSYIDQYDEHYSVTFSVKTADNPFKLTKPQKVKSKVRYDRQYSRYCADITWASVKDAQGYYLFEYDKKQKKYQYLHYIDSNKITLPLNHAETKFKIIAVDAFGDISDPFCFTVKVKS
ncbi:MAG: hypothetical protein SOZ34_06975 [Clostridia bacterium]|nr:hypothetical protein [Clostridia bacterium]